MEKIEIPSMKREERTSVISFIKHGFTCTLKEVKEATGLSKEDILSKLENLGFIKPWDKNPVFKFAAKANEQPVPYSVVSYAYTKGGAKNYGRDTLWLFKPYVIEILLGQEPDIESFEPIYILSEYEFNIVKDILSKNDKNDGNDDDNEMVLVSAADDIWMSKKECDELGIPY